MDLFEQSERYRLHSCSKQSSYDEQLLVMPSIMRVQYTRGVQYIGGVQCSVDYWEYPGRLSEVHWGGGVIMEYIGGLPGVHLGLLSTLNGYHDAVWGGGYPEYIGDIGGCSVHWERTSDQESFGTCRKIDAASSFCID